MERRFNSLRSLREYKHWSMDALAKKLGVTAPTVWKWEQKEIEEGPDWLKPKHRNILKVAFTDEELSEAFDPDWTPSIVLAESQPSDELTSADVISELMAIMAKLSLNEMKAVLNSAKAVLATKENMSLPTVTKDIT